MPIIHKDFKIVSGSYVPDKDAYIVDIYYKYGEKSDYKLIAEINFYDEDFRKPMDVELLGVKLIPLNDFLETINISINEVKAIIKEKNINKDTF